MSEEILSVTLIGVWPLITIDAITHCILLDQLAGNLRSQDSEFTLQPGWQGLVSRCCIVKLSFWDWRQLIELSYGSLFEIWKSSEQMIHKSVSLFSRKTTEVQKHLKAAMHWMRATELELHLDKTESLVLLVSMTKWTTRIENIFNRVVLPLKAISLLGDDNRFNQVSSVSKQRPVRVPTTNLPWEERPSSSDHLITCRLDFYNVLIMLPWFK